MNYKIVWIILLVVALSGCSGSPTPTEILDFPLPEPTATIIPTEIPLPTDIPEPTAQPTEIPTEAPSTPEAVLQIVFDVANSGDFSLLATLCDPLGENDGDTQWVCDTATETANQAEFVEYFIKAQLNGNALIDGDLAEVPFLFGPAGDIEENMGMIQRDGKWYLMDF